MPPCRNVHSARFRKPLIQNVEHHARIHMMEYLTVNDHVGTIRTFPRAQTAADLKIHFIFETAFLHEFFRDIHIFGISA